MVTFEKRRSLFRLQVAEGCIDHALNACNQLIEMDANDSEGDRIILTAAMYTLYSRPFTVNKGLGTLSEKLVPRMFRSHHREVVGLRNKVYAHSDIENDSSWNMPDGEIPIKAIATVKNRRWEFGYATICPNSVALKKNRDLFHAVKREILKALEELIPPLLVELDQLPDGRYEIDLDEEQEAPLLKKLDHGT